MSFMDKMQQVMEKGEADKKRQKVWNKVALHISEYNITQIFNTS